MASFNRVILMGNLTRDPEVRFLPSGKAVAAIGLAISSKYRTPDGQEHEEVCFVSCQYLKKGRQVLIEGRLRYESWEKDGQKRNALKVIADRVQFLGGGKAGEGGEAGASSGSSGGGERRPAVKHEEPAAEEAPSGHESGDDDNLPF